MKSKMSKEYSESFIPRRVTIYKCSNYKGEQPVEIEFEDLNGILGETGAGKSSIIDGITFPIWKTSPRLKGRGIKLSDFCDEGGFCEVEFEKNGNLYEIRRGISGGSSFVVLTENGERYPETKPTIIDEKINEIIGMEYDAFATTAYIPQDEVKDIILSTPSQRLELFKKIFKLNVFDTAKKIAIDRLKAIEKQISRTEGEISEKRNFVDRNKNIKVEIVENKKKIPPLTKKIKKIEEDRIKFKEELDKLKKDEEEYSKLNGLLTSKKTDLSKSQENLERLRKSLKDYKKSREEKESEDLEDKGTLEDHLEKIQKVKTLTNILNTSKLQYLDMEKKYHDRKSQINLQSKDFDISGMELLRQFRIDESITAKKVYEVIESEVIRHLYENIDQEFEEETQSIRNQINETKNEIQSIYEIVGEDQTDRTIKQRIQAIEDHINSISDLDTRISEMTVRISEETENVDTLVAKISDIEMTIEDFVTAHEEYKKKDNELTQIQQNLVEVVGEKKSLMGEIKQLKNRLAQIKTAKKELENKLDIHKKMIEQRTILDIIKRSVFHKKGMAMFTLKSILSDIEFKASEIITTLTYHREPAFKENGMPNRMQKLSLVEVGGRGGGIDIEVDGINAQRFSGGEKTIISMALRLALSQQLMEMSSLASSMRVLIIDEGDLGSLDDLTLQSFIHLLQSYEDVFDTIILITHIEGATDGFTHVVKVEKNEETGYSNVIV